MTQPDNNSQTDNARAKTGSKILPDLWGWGPINLFLVIMATLGAILVCAFGYVDPDLSWLDQFRAQNAPVGGGDPAQNAAGLGNAIAQNPPPLASIDGVEAETVSVSPALPVDAPPPVQQAEPASPTGLASGPGNPAEASEAPGGDSVDTDDELFQVSATSLDGIACLTNGQLMISFATPQIFPSESLALTVGGRAFQQLPVEGFYFVGPAPASLALELITLTLQPGNTVEFSELYSVPACRPPAPTSAVAAPSPTPQPDCQPPEFFDPLMNRCRIAGSEPTDEPAPAHSAPPKATPSPEPTATQPTPTEPTPTEPTPTEPTPTEPTPTEPTPTEPTPTPTEPSPTPTGTPCDC